MAIGGSFLKPLVVNLNGSYFAFSGICCGWGRWWKNSWCTGPGSVVRWQPGISPKVLGHHDKHIDQLYRQIELDCMQLLAQQALENEDLRRIGAFCRWCEIWSGLETTPKTSVKWP